MEAGQSAVRAPSGIQVLGGGRRRWTEDAVKAFLLLCALISILTTIGILVALLEETIAFFGDVSIVEFFTTSDWSPLFADPKFGVWPLVWGTLMVTMIALLVAIPLGLGAAVYLSEYARPRVRKTVKPILEVLAGIPTIVFGYFALTFFTPEILQGIFGTDRVQIFNALSAGIIMGFMVLPTIASVAEDAMSAVPHSLREGAFGLGASKLQVSLRVVFPAALSGVVAAVVLGASRAIGETMIVLVAAGSIASSSPNAFEPHATMTAFIGTTAKGDVPTGSIGYETIFAVGATLFFMTLVINAVAIRFVRRYRQVYE
ncbi:MAG TPA: phosphate ABC transporter permease subunit PstC [Thermoleophilaceae bacterium]|nr:phosphate ABC transporter permease subunit PstC [Thermoleophilaceae bacterium]